ncbi:hypothetical protein RG963_03405 [Methanosarcina sp. Z-7115]|uniref:Integrase n=1 Tax=Methanosarcina baikalica TaxID=3073890 RepID=A0ABU2CYR9_9EURY|nr:hypothetical protein [Methanosarcina sp. Z-7115]MDR7664847.1 hypothetical protein [Methanosarcina sp. Z-7115]
MKIDDLKLDPIVMEWISIINIKQSTIKSYLFGMQVYTDYTNMTSEQLLDVAESEAHLIMRKRSVNKNINDFREYLKSQNLAELTVKTYLTGVKSFYHSFEIEFRNIKDKSHPKPLEENIPIPTKDDLRDILKICDPLEKAIVLVAASSGLDRQTIMNLKIKDFISGYDHVTGITTLIIKT